MKMLIQDALLVTVNPRDEVLHGDLLIEDGEIISVGPRVDPAAEGVERVIDGSRFIALPGLVNAHCHLVDYLFKGRHYGRPLEIWRQYSRAARRVLREEHLYVGALLGSLELLRSDATSVLDHH